MKRNWLLFFLFIVFLPLFSQNTGLKRNPRVESQLNYLASKIPQSMMDIPMGYKRVAIFEMRSDLPSTYLSVEDWRNKFIEKLMELGMQVIAVPEFDDKITLKIQTSDSSLYVDNRSAISRLKSNPKALQYVCEQYQVQALFSCHIFLDSVNGPRVSMRLLNPSSRAIIWLKNLDLSQDLILKPVVVTLSGGLLSQRVDQIKEASTGKVLAANRSVVPVLLNFGIAQYLDPDRSNLFGLNVGGRVVDKTPVNYSDTSLGRMGMSLMPHLGMIYQVNFKRKPRIMPYYWGFVQFGVNYMYHREQGLVGFHQKIGVQLTDNIAVDFRFEQFLNGYSSLSANQFYTLQFDNVTFGFNVSLLF